MGRATNRSSIPTIEGGTLHGALVRLSPLVLAAGCSLGGAAGGRGGTIEGVRWILTSYRASGSNLAVPAGVAADARFKDGTVSGSGGCNSYSAACTVTESRLTVGEITATLMGCDGPRGEVESAHLAALGSAASFTATADRLTLFDGAGTAVLEYVPGTAKS